LFGGFAVEANQGTDKEAKAGSIRFWLLHTDMTLCWPDPVLKKYSRAKEGNVGDRVARAGGLSGQRTIGSGGGRTEDRDDRIGDRDTGGNRQSTLNAIGGFCCFGFNVKFRLSDD
jgi:hypothetical protein